jgi:flagellar FliL protein
VSQAPTTSETAPAPAGGRRKILLIAIAALFLGGGIGAGAYWWSRDDAPHEETPISERGMVKFDAFVVNLADKEASRFLRTSVQLIVADEAQAAEVQEQPVALMKARAAVLEQLTLQTADVLVTPEGKAALRKAIAAQVTATLHDVEVIDVLFSDFVVQF